MWARGDRVLLEGAPARHAKHFAAPLPTWHRAHVRVARDDGPVRQLEAFHLAVVREEDLFEARIEAHLAARRLERVGDRRAEPLRGHAVQERHLGAVLLLQEAVERDEDAWGGGARGGVRTRSVDF